MLGGALKCGHHSINLTTLNRGELLSCTISNVSGLTLLNESESQHCDRHHSYCCCYSQHIALFDQAKLTSHCSVVYCLQGILHLPIVRLSHCRASYKYFF